MTIAEHIEAYRAETDRLRAIGEIRSRFSVTEDVGRGIDEVVASIMLGSQLIGIIRADASDIPGPPSVVRTSEIQS